MSGYFNNHMADVPGERLVELLYFHDTIWLSFDMKFDALMVSRTLQVMFCKLGWWWNFSKLFGKVHQLTESNDND